jgi:hypothetical protein
MDAYDESGWWMGALEPLPVAEAYSLLAPDASSRIDAARWAHQAQRFFELTLSIHPDKQYPGGGQPRADAFEVRIARAPATSSAAGPAPSPTSTVRVITLPIDHAPAVPPAAARAAEAIGGAGFDVLVARAKRVWQVHRVPLDGDDPRASLRVAAVIASLLLAPLLTPSGEIFGVKGARERLASP